MELIWQSSMHSSNVEESDIDAFEEKCCRETLNSAAIGPLEERGWEAGHMSVMYTTSIAPNTIYKKEP